MKETEILRKCFEMIMSRNPQFGDVANWGEPHFKKLSDDILSKSGILISITTLKRCFGKRKYSDNYNPQLETKNAFAIYLGYENWNAFLNSTSKPGSTISNETIDNSPTRRSPLKYTYIVLACLIIIATIGAFFWIKEKSKPLATLYISTHSGVPPLNVGIHFRLPELNKKDSFFLDNGDRSIYLLQPGDTFKSYPYLVCGYYHIRLLKGRTELATEGVSIKSDGWVKGLSVLREEFIPIHEKQPDDDGSLPFVTENKVKELFDHHERFWLRYRNIRDFNVDGDNFCASVEVINNIKTGGQPYYDIIMKIYGEHKDIEVFFIDKGISFWSINRFSEILLNGATSDLSAFVRNLSDWHNVKIKVSQKNAKVYFDNDSVYSIHYNQPLGLIKGLEVSFRGTGNFKNYQLKDGSENTVYCDSIPESIQK
jgi:hypothetical protein